jgi:hypothetical protein
VRAWDGHEVVDLAVGHVALHYAEENPVEVVPALDDETEPVIRELEAQHKEARRSLRRRRDRARGPPTLPREDVLRPINTTMQAARENAWRMAYRGFGRTAQQSEELSLIRGVNGKDVD